MYTTRFYRTWTRAGTLRRFRVRNGSSDLEIAAGFDCTETACRLLRRARRAVKDRIGRDPHFGTSLAPLPVAGGEPEPVATMLRAGREWDVGPMAAVGGAIAGFVGRGLASRGPVIVENGGDIYARGPGELVVGLYAGEESPFGRAVEFCVDASGGVDRASREQPHRPGGGLLPCLPGDVGRGGGAGQLRRAAQRRRAPGWFGAENHAAVQLPEGPGDSGGAEAADSRGHLQAVQARGASAGQRRLSATSSLCWGPPGRGRPPAAAPAGCRRGPPGVWRPGR